MQSIQDEYFFNGLKNDVLDKIDTLIKKSKAVKIYTSFQIKGSIVAIMGFFLYYFFTTGNYSFNNIWRSYEFYIAVLGLLIYNATLEKAMEPLKKEIKKLTETIKNRMILKVCNCDGYCECKEELNDYMKKRGVKII